METFYLSIAKKIIKVSSLHEAVKTYCQDFLVERCPEDYALEISQDDIEYERGLNEYPFTDDVLEITALHRKIAETLYRDDIIAFHGSAIKYQGNAYLYTARSGVGKSTHTNLIKEQLKDEMIWINDDKPFIEVKKNQITLYSSPFNGKERRGCNTFAPLKAITQIKRGTENYVNEIEPVVFFPLLVSQCYKGRTPEMASRVMDLLDLLSTKIHCYEIYFRPDIEAAEVSIREILKK
jgi:hypothetical protein